MYCTWYVVVAMESSVHTALFGHLQLISYSSLPLWSCWQTWMSSFKCPLTFHKWHMFCYCWLGYLLHNSCLVLENLLAWYPVLHVLVMSPTPINHLLYFQVGKRKPKFFSSQIMQMHRLSLSFTMSTTPETFSHMTLI